MSIIGIDIASKSATFCVLSNTGNVLDHGLFSMTMEAFKSFLSSPAIDKNSIFAMESTGCYHVPLFNYLLNKELNVIIINPLLIKRYKDTVTLRKTKTDNLDAIVIAKYVITHPDVVSGRKTELADEGKSYSRRRLANSQDLTKAKNVLKSDLTISFPELLTINVFRDSVLNLLTKFACAKDVNRATTAQLGKAIRGSRKSNTASDIKLIKEIKDLAKDSIGLATQAAATRDSARRVIFFKEEDMSLTKALIEAEKETHPTEIKILISIPGISDITAAHFMAEIGDIHNFSSYQKVIAFAGTDPTIYQSGKVDRHNAISKKGDKVLRKYIYLMAQSCLIHNTTLKTYYQKKRSEGFVYRKAVIATGNKLIRMIYTLLLRGEEYQSDKAENGYKESF